MTRLYQGFSFVVNEVVDRPLIRICGSVDLEAIDNSPIVVFLRLDRPMEWHRLFLDAGAAFWEKCSDADIADEHQDCSIRLIEYFSEILPRTIECVTALEPQESLPARIFIKLDNRFSIQLACQNDTIDAPTIISLD